MSKSIIILGSKGFIGSSICGFLAKKGYELKCSDLFIDVTSENYFHNSNPETLLDYFSQNKFDFCINAAGSGNVLSSISNPSFDFNANVSFTQTILEIIRKTQLNCKYIHFSSAAVYGNPVEIPIAEVSKLMPISPYGFHKVLAERICKQYSELYGIKCIVLRPFSVYGPGLKKQILWDVHEKMRLSHSSERISFFGTGNETRDFVYIDDVCQIVELLIEKVEGLAKYEVLNISNCEEVEIRLIIEIVASKFGERIFYFCGKSREGDPRNWKGDNSKLKRLGYVRKFTFEQGLKEYTNWYINNFCEL